MGDRNLGQQLADGLMLRQVDTGVDGMLMAEMHFFFNAVLDGHFVNDSWFVTKVAIHRRYIS